MDRKKSAIRAVAVLAVAFAAGHLAQTMNDAKTAAAKVKPSSVEQVSAGAKKAPPVSDPVMPSTASLGATPLPAPETATATPPAASAAPAAGAEEPKLATLPDPKPIDPVPDASKTPPVVEAVAKADPDTAPPLPAAPADPAGATASACDADLSLAAKPGAMLDLSLVAPCRAGERVVLRHAGLTIAETLSAEGRLDLDLPALDAKGEVSVLFADASVLQSATAVPDVAKVHRFAVQWMADDTFQLHALERGVDYGQPGHVRAGSGASPDGGFVIALGDPALDLPMMAEIYTWPADATVPVEISIEAEVTEATCGRELLGETVETGAEDATVTDLSLAMPDCDAVGDILVLKNPGQDVTLAAAD